MITQGEAIKIFQVHVQYWSNGEQYDV